ncbi:hypothetical protein I3843_08G154200, partial [Carya illinoinensis]
GSATSSCSANSPSKYLTSCCIVGRASGASLEHIKPSLSTKTASNSPPPPPNFGSITPRIAPTLHFCHTQSTSMNSSDDASELMGLLPHATSSNRAPKAKTSELVVALPVRVSSGTK